ncbi:hypothetical protein LJR034_004711 [Caballeronia sp. LjRoot34]|uniref:hypothetical protein n=1 Tax=Caballeronia sp. LjRoot34 TaxID=3342325 RepID=UPI003ECE879F
MPIAVNYVTPNTGAAATYHVVQQITLDYVSSITNSTVSSYLSKDAKDAGKFPMYTQQIPVDGLPAAAQDARAYAEGRIVESTPDGTTVVPYANRYAFAGGTIVE